MLQYILFIKKIEKLLSVNKLKKFSQRGYYNIKYFMLRINIDTMINSLLLVIYGVLIVTLCELSIKYEIKLFITI